MPAEKARTGHDQVPRKREFRAGRMPAPHPRDQGAEEKEGRSVGTESVNCANPAFGARHLVSPQ